MVKPVESPFLLLHSEPFAEEESYQRDDAGLLIHGHLYFDGRSTASYGWEILELVSGIELFGKIMPVVLGFSSKP